MNTEHPNPNPNTPEDEALAIHWKNGIQSWFDIDGITIEVWASSWSGKEEVRIEGRVISSLRSLRRKSVHRFTHDGHDYKVTVACLAFGTGTFQITLFRDGTEVDSDTGSAMGRDMFDEDNRILWGKLVRKLAPVFLVSGLAGMAFGYTVASLLK